MAKVMTQLDILTKHVMWAAPKKVNIIDSKGTQAYDDNDNVESLDEKFMFISNQIGVLLTYRSKPRQESKFEEKELWLKGLWVEKVWSRKRLER